MTEPADVSKIQPGRTGRATLEVRADHSAKVVGSGDMDVLATPVMVALMEAAAVNCLDGVLPAGSTSLGIKLDVVHQAPTAIGGFVEASAQIVSAEHRRIVFKVEARDRAGLIGQGEHERAIVDKDRFLAKLRQRSESHAG